MVTLSHNEQQNRQAELRHIFWPNTYGLISESIIGIVALVIFNATQLGNTFLAQETNVGDPRSLLLHPLHQVLAHLETYRAVQQVLLFVLWAIVGALIYILLYRILQIGFGIKHSVGSGVTYVQQDPHRGIFRWLASLHDFFIKAVLFGVGLTTVAMGTVVCFGIASQELTNGLAEVFPANVLHIVVSLVAAALSVRVVVTGLTLLSSRFRSWYTV